MKYITLGLIAALALTGCSNNDDRVTFDGYYFRTKVKRVDRQLDQFTVEIRDAAQSLEGARQAGRFAGVEHCVEYFGSSDILWTVGPETPAQNLQIVDDRLIFRGTCPST
ncbi:MAG: hypothetical protein P1U53_05205 [Sulfitobacter sp.]|nr:hypothetical protein [Sulfitobacter sp.]